MSQRQDVNKKNFKNLQSYHYQLYSSIEEINPHEWGKIVDESVDLAMNRELIHLTERSLSDQAKFWTVIFRFEQEPVACACLSLFLADTIQSAPSFIKKWVTKLRQYKSNFLKLGVLFCGLPLPSAHSHIRIVNPAHKEVILYLLTQLMKKLSIQEKASLIVIKELDSLELQAFDSLRQYGFIEGPVQPTHELKFTFDSFDHYCNSLRSNYRHQIRQNVKKFNNANLSVKHFIKKEDISTQFTEEVYQLYLAVWSHSKERLEQFPISFFQELGATLPDKVVLTMVYYEENPIAFSIGIRNINHYYNLYCGVNYSLKESLDLYFNLFYHELDQAFKQNVRSIFLGQTSDYFKSRLGSTPLSRHFFVRARNQLGHLGLKLFSRFIFPKPPPVSEQKVFKVNELVT